jgi:hypothetical protein
MKNIYLSFLVVCSIGFWPASDTFAKEVLLKVSGLISNTNSKDKKSYGFSQNDLERLANINITATTPHAGKAIYSGPRVSTILSLVGAKNDVKEIVALGLDGYRVKIPIQEFNKYEIIIATAQNGKRLTLETKGPFWLMYPIDKYPKELINSTIDNRLVWALVGLTLQ